MNHSITAVCKCMLSILLVLCATVLSAQNVPSYVPTDGLVGWWPFNGNANDESGNGNDGTVNGADPTTNRHGSSNSAYSFNGTTDYISIPNGPDFNFLLNNSYTVNLYVRLNTQPNPGNEWSSQAIMSHGDYDACCQDRGIVLWLGNGDGNDEGLIYEARGNGGDPATTSCNYASPQLNTWTMVTITRTYGTNCRIYVDGVLIEEQVDIAGLADPFSETRNIILGAMIKGRTQDNPNPGAEFKQYLDGKIDDVAVWDRVLTQTEISGLYQECADITISTQPVGLASSPGQAASVSVVATSSNTISYQWQLNTGNGFENINNNSIYSGATSTSLSIASFSSAESGTYRCVLTTNVCSVNTAQVQLTVSTVDAYVPNNGLLGWWPYNGNSDDQSGSNRNLTNYGATLSTDRHGVANSAYQFDGTNDYMRVDVDQPESFTLSAWILIDDDTRMNGLMQYKYPCVRGGGTAVTGSYGQLGAGTMACGECSINTCNNWSGDRLNIFLLGEATWRHIVLSVDGVDKFRLYVDGDLVNTYTNAALITTYADLPLIIGKVHDENPAYHLGKVDEIGLWNRALTASEITGLYESLRITSHPTGPSVAGGHATTLSVAATTTNGAAVTYAWQRYNGSSYVNLTDGADYSGATTSTITVKSARVSQSGPFRCVVSTTNATVYSNTASLTVTCPCNE